MADQTNIIIDKKYITFFKGTRQELDNVIITSGYLQLSPTAKVEFTDKK